MARSSRRIRPVSSGSGDDILSDQTLSCCSSKDIREVGAGGVVRVYKTVTRSSFWVVMRAMQLMVVMKSKGMQNRRNKYLVSVSFPGIDQEVPEVKELIKTEYKPVDENSFLVENLTKTLFGMKILECMTDEDFIYYQPASTEHLNVYVVTWNMNGKALGSIAKLLDADREKYDLYVIGLQEAHSSIDWSIIAKGLGQKYSLVATASMSSLQLFIVARKTIFPFLSNLLVDKVSTGGLGGFAGRQKGAVAVSLSYKRTSLFFIVCHLAAHEGKVGIRNAQYDRISHAVFSKLVQAVPSVQEYDCSGCPNCKNTLVLGEPVLCVQRRARCTPKFHEQADLAVWLGDLNYRVEMTRSSVAFLMKHKLEEVLWSKDQLISAVKQEQAFTGFQEGPLSFSPTYKFDVDTDNYDTSPKERVPSWTDRILYKVGDDSKLKVRLRSYNSIDSIKTSDHRPVKAVFRLSFPNGKKSSST